MVFTLIFIAATLFLSGSFVWFWFQAPQLEGLAAMVFEWCRNMAVSCASLTTLAMASLMWAGAIVLGAGLVYAAVRQGRGLLRSYRALGRLPVYGRSRSVALIKDDSVRTAFTHGLIRPRIYVSTGLINALTRKELNSVLLHEIHHRRNRDPLRVFLAAFFRDAFFYLPIGDYLAGRHHAFMERAADESVVSRTKDPLNLAGALVKVALSRLSAPRMPAPGPVFFSGASVEGRVRRLVEGTEEAHPAPGTRVVISSTIIAMVMAVSILLPVASYGRYKPVFCTKSHCSMMGGQHYHLGATSSHMSCKTHCKLKRAGLV